MRMSSPVPTSGFAGAYFRCADGPRFFNPELLSFHPSLCVFSHTKCNNLKSHSSADLHQCHCSMKVGCLIEIKKSRHHLMRLETAASFSQHAAWPAKFLSTLVEYAGLGISP